MDAQDSRSHSDPDLGFSRTLLWKPVYFLLKKSVQNSELISTNQLFLTHIPPTLHFPYFLQNLGFIDSIFLWFPILPLMFWSLSLSLSLCLSLSISISLCINICFFWEVGVNVYAQFTILETKRPRVEIEENERFENQLSQKGPEWYGLI